MSASHPYTVCIITHCTPSGVFGYLGQPQSGLGLVIATIATIAILRSRCNQLTVITYHVSTTRLARVPLPRVALHGIEPKAKLRGLGTVLGIRGILEVLDEIPSTILRLPQAILSSHNNRHLTTYQQTSLCVLLAVVCA